MNGRHVLLILAHLFRKFGESVTIEVAVEFLSFKCRYGTPTNIRRMLTAAIDNELVSREEDSIQAEFLFDKQEISLNQTSSLQDKVIVEGDYDPLY